MEFTGLNMILISGCSITIGVIGAMVGMSRRFVTKESCTAQHRYDSKSVEELAKLIDKIQRNTDIQFRMLRAMVSHMDLTPDQRAQILNAEPSDNRRKQS